MGICTNRGWIQAFAQIPPRNNRGIISALHYSVSGPGPGANGIIMKLGMCATITSVGEPKINGIITTSGPLPRFRLKVIIRCVSNTKLLRFAKIIRFVKNK